ncbi:uncharacterized protein LOC141685379 [Apium graveolens]|uniref:uncharacterized protein LOC141685379 n=1 Tax=Apium graveolens TaxID=4045 RepID=UPI003D79C054
MGSLRAVRIFENLLKSSNPDFVFLSETLSDKKDIKELANKFGFFDYFTVDKVGRLGGLAIMWKRFVGCNMIDFLNNHIDVHIMEGSNSLLDGFKAIIDDCGLLEVDLKGGDYTWEKSKGKPNWVRERLDRAFADANWWRKFPLCKLTVTHTIKFDHDPILLEPVNTEFSRKQFRFKFENTWLHECSFKDEVVQYWKEIPKIHLLPKLLFVLTFMARWGRTFFHKFRDKVKKQKGIICSLVDRIDEEGVKRYFEERQKLEDLLMHEELYWKQRIKAFWLTEGDTNSKYFHVATSKKKKLNHITHLVTGENEVVDNHDGMGRVVLDYFRSVFNGENSGSVQLDNAEAHVISDEHNTRLTIEINFTEFIIALKKMHPDKSVVPDGLNPAFFSIFGICWTRKCLTVVRIGCLSAHFQRI